MRRNWFKTQRKIEFRKIKNNQYLLLQFSSTARAFQAGHINFLQQFSPTIETYARLAFWTIIICAPNDFLADWARSSHTFLRHTNPSSMCCQTIKKRPLLFYKLVIRTRGHANGSSMLYVSWWLRFKKACPCWSAAYSIFPLVRNFLKVTI
jgi:hypothetical protein